MADSSGASTGRSGNLRPEEGCCQAFFPVAAHAWRLESVFGAEKAAPGRIPGKVPASVAADHRIQGLVSVPWRTFEYRRRSQTRDPVEDQPKDLLGNCDLGHLEHNIPGVPHHFRADFD